MSIAAKQSDERVTTCFVSPTSIRSVVTGATQTDINQLSSSPTGGHVTLYPTAPAQSLLPLPPQPAHFAQQVRPTSYQPGLAPTALGTLHNVNVSQGSWRLDESPLAWLRDAPAGWPGPDSWITGTATQLMELFRLPPNWDTYGAPPIDRPNALRVLRLLFSKMQRRTPPPTVVPLSSGGVQLEWHRRGFNVEAAFEPGEQPIAFVEDGSGREWEGPPELAFDEFRLAIGLV